MIIPADIQTVPLSNVVLVFTAIYIAHKLVKAYRFRARSTPLAGPPRPSWLFGVSKLVGNNPNASSIYEEWVDKYGSVFLVPAPLGGKRVILTDPKAIAHFYSVETWTYVNTKLSRVAIANLVRLSLMCTSVGVPMSASLAVAYCGPKAIRTRGMSSPLSHVITPMTPRQATQGDISRFQQRRYP